MAGEARYRLAPLALPDLDDLAGVACAEAVALFADRARNADAHFALDDRSAPAVARLVTRLDGMPLAIELAAARVEALGVIQLLDRLDDRFGYWRAATAWRRPGSSPWPPRWSGVTSCWMRPGGGCSARCRCSRGRSRWRGPRRWPGPAPGRRCCTWWTARCWFRREWIQMAGPGTGCWQEPEIQAAGKLCPSPARCGPARSRGTRDLAADGGSARPGNAPGALFRPRTCRTRR